ncbi:MAG: type II secretion system protein GspG [Phycisphaerales bacterium]|nr:type II secretion system protein GspG [Phycisphaerales bacterium]
MTLGRTGGWLVRVLAAAFGLVAAIAAVAPAAARDPASAAPTGQPAEPAASPAPDSAKPARAAEATAAGHPWLRTRDAGERIRRLEVLQQPYRLVNAEGAPVAGSPTVTLVGAIHIADRSFYRTLQKFLDGQDLVLFEGVAPPGFGSGEPKTDAERAETTKARLRTVGLIIEKHRKESGAYPESLATLGEELARHRRAQMWLAKGKADGWGRALVYERAADGASFTLRSLGADGRPGGEGPAADAALSDLEPFKPAELEDQEGLQSQLARALDLTFQIDEMDMLRPQFKNSDMSVDQVNARIVREGGDAAPLLSMLDGSSFTARLAGTVLKLIELLPGASARGKLMIMEMMSSVDESLMATSMPGGKALLKVIIDERNQVVLDDLKAALDAGKARNIAVIYGGGHMPDLERRMEKELGLRPVPDAETWNAAITLDMEKEGIPPSEVRMMRNMIRQQLQMMKRGGR